MSKPNKFQAAVAKTYGGGDYAHLADSEAWHGEAQSCGDTLFLFLMIELSDDGEPMNSEVAEQRLEKAREDIGGALWAIGRVKS